MHKKKLGCADLVNLERLAVDLQSPDEKVRAKAVGSLCPCRVGMDTFQHHWESVMQFRKDPSPIVRASVLHVLEEAGEKQNEGYPTNPRELTNEMLRRWRISRFPSDETEPVEVRKMKRSKGQMRLKA